MRQSDNSEAVRPLRSPDVWALVDLWVAAWQEAMPGIDFEARRDWITRLLTAAGHTTLVADVSGRQVGFVTLEETYLHQLVVAPAAKGTGIAVRLLGAAKARAPAGLALDVNQANSRAVRFYEREGFRRVGAGVNPASGLATWSMRWP